jgi:radical SAM protein with 4Fe4S-binding SPASM domain
VFQEGIAWLVGHLPFHWTPADPVAAEVERVYRRFLFRSPTAAEIARHIDHFCRDLPAEPDRLNAIRAGEIRWHLGIRPLKMEMDVTNQCNLRCLFCHFSLEHISRQKRDDMSLEDFTRVAEQVFPLCESVNLAYTAEPLLHRQFGELMGIAERYRVPSVGITTNGLLLDEARIEQVIVGRLNHAVISIDGATKPTYERLRRHGRFDRLVDNIRAINCHKRRRSTLAPQLAFSFIMMRSNIRELPLLVQLAHDLEVPIVIANHLTPLAGLGMADEVMSIEPDLANRMMDEARELAARYLIEIRLPARFDRPPAPSASPETAETLPPVLANASPVDPTISKPEHRRDKTYFMLPVRGDDRKSHCLYPWHYVIISRYGDVLPCGGWWEKPYGNVFREPFEEVWNNGPYRVLRDQHVTGKLGPTCRTCPATMMGNVDSDSAFSVRTL